MHIRMAGLLLLTLLVSGPACTRNGDSASATMSPAEQEQVVGKAIALLDSNTGDMDELQLAADGLQQVLDANPRHVQAHIEMARFYLKFGCTSDSCEPEFSMRADDELDAALRIDPGSANAFVLRGILRLYEMRLDESLEALDQAEKIGTDNPWLYMNYASTYLKMHDWDKALASLEKLERQISEGKKVPRKIVLYMHSLMTDAYEKKKNYSSADLHYRKIIVMDPGSSYARGNYAGFLLWKIGDIDGSIAEATKALELMNYPLAHYVLGQAQYAKWAQLRKSDPGHAKLFFIKARENLPDIGFAITNGSCSLGQNVALQTLIEGLVERGESIDTKGDDGDNALTFSANCGELEAVKWLLAHGASVNVVEEQGWTPLALAVGRGYEEVVTLLIENGANVDRGPESGSTPLMIAITNNYPAIAKKLIAAKANPDTADRNGVTPLIFAATQGFEPMVRELLQAGADPKIKDRSGKTAAELADLNGKKNIGDLIRGFHPQ